MATTQPNTDVLSRPADATSFDVDDVRKDFPILDLEVNGHGLVYFDNAATAHKPRQVINAVSGYYETLNSNVHRGVHTLSQKSTDLYEDARSTAASFLNARSDREIVFTSGTTHGINLVASAFAASELTEGDEVLVTEIEHHSNFVPWQQACLRTGARLRVVRAEDNGGIDLDRLAEMMSPRTRLVAITHVSNTLGTIVDLRKVVELAHANDALVASDGAQAVPHLRVDVQDLDVDFYTFSGHKLFGPMGIGVLYGKEALLDLLPPMQTGGGMIDRVKVTETTWADLPHKHEAGTPNVAGAIGLAAAIDYVSEVGFAAIEAHESNLTSYMTDSLQSVSNLRVFGPADHRASVFSVALGSAHPFDVGSLLDQMGIAVRTGHHCNQPLMARLGVPGTVRASLALYNTHDEIDRFVEALLKIQEMLA